MSSRGISHPRLYDLLLLCLVGGREQAYREALLDVAGAAPGQRVLDVGCGTGTLAITTWRRVQPGGSVTGVDISAKMLAVARRKTRRAGLDVALHQADAAQLPFEAGRFDLVTATTVMHMVPERDRPDCLREAARVLKQDGSLLLVDYAGALETRKGWVAKHGPHGRFDLERLREPLGEAGFARIAGGSLDWLSLRYLRATK